MGITTVTAATSLLLVGAVRIAKMAFNSVQSSTQKSVAVELRLSLGSDLIIGF